MHPNAKLTPLGRAELLRRIKAGAKALGVSRRTVFKWFKSFRQDGERCLQDRSSCPRRTQAKLSQSQIEQVELLRRQRWTGEQIARASRISRSTVFSTLHKLELSRLKRLPPKQPPQRYGWAKPGQLFHIDIKKLGRVTKVGHRITGDRRDTTRVAGWEYVHVYVNDHSRIACVEVMRDERKKSAVAFLKATVRYYGRLGLRIERVMTDNGSCYISKAFCKTYQKLGLRHIWTRPYTPRANGKAERFIQTALREWAYAKAYAHSRQKN